MSKRKALVTGCCGFIGSHLTHALVQAGWHVEGVDNLSSGTVESLQDLDAVFIEGESDTSKQSSNLVVFIEDFADESVLARVKEGHYDVIFHLAANPRVEYSVKHPAKTTYENVQNTIELMTAARSNIERFVFASSSACYGDVKSLPTTEKEETSPTSPYGLQKLVVEQFGKVYSNLYDFKFTALRFFNVYGPGQDGTSPYSTAICAWCTRLSNGTPLRSDGDGEQSRDMVYVTDVAHALISAAENSAGDAFEVYNIGTGKSVTNNDILAYLQKRFPGTQIENAPARPGDVRHTLASIEKVERTLGWKPQTDFYDGLNKTLTWWKLDTRSQANSFVGGKHE
jgi:UDP-glucose 4-epimerase